MKSPKSTTQAASIEELLTAVTDANEALQIGLTAISGQTIMYKKLPHKVVQRKGTHFLRCCLTAEAIATLKENGLLD